MSNLDTITYKSIIERLQSDENKRNALLDMKNLLEFKPKPIAASTIKSAGISKIVDCLNETDGVQTDLACDVLKICFEKFNTGEVIKNYTSHIMYLLRHEKPCVRKLAIDEVYKTLTGDISLLPVTDYIDVFVAVAQLVCDMDIAIANKAVLITSNLPNEAYPKILEEMKIALEATKSSKCNAYEVAMNISTKSFDLFELCINEGYIQSMVSELESDDVLYQMNILELLSQLAVKPHGINYFVKFGVLQKITELLVSLKDNPLKGLLAPGYMKFFGCVAHYYPREIFEKYPALVDSLFDAFEVKDETMPVALDTLSYIGTTAEGKLCLAALGGKYIQALETLGQILRNSPTDVKIRILNTFANLIGVDKDLECNKNPNHQRLDLLTREWFRCFSKEPGPINKLFELCKSSFSDIKVAALTLLEAVCQHTWGEQLVATTPGLIEYLLDRKEDVVTYVQEAKYNVIVRLSTSTAFDANLMTRIQTYVQQGPFYIDMQLHVAMEEQN